MDLKTWIDENLVDYLIPHWVHIAQDDGAEIVSQVVEQCFSKLKCPPRRLGLPDHPTPSTRALVAEYYPRAEHIAGVICEVTQVGPEIVHTVVDALSVDRQTHPIDVPHPTFQGPF